MINTKKPDDWESMTQEEQKKWMYKYFHSPQVRVLEMESEAFGFTVLVGTRGKIRGGSVTHEARCDLDLHNLSRETRTEIIAAAREFEKVVRKIVAREYESLATETD